MKSKATPLLLPLLLAFLFLGTTNDASAKTVRVVFFSGAVTIKSGSKSAKPRLGQQLKTSDRVVVGRGGSVQLSVNGKVLRYTKKATIKVADVVKRAGSGQNSVVAGSVRTLAGASGAGRSSRSSVAGATRADGGKDVGYFDSVRSDAINTGTLRINGEVSEATGIDDVVGELTKLGETTRSETLVILQPRSTAVTLEELTFRWARPESARRFLLTVLDHRGDEVYRAETDDTLHVWSDGASLDPGAIYTWRLADADNPNNRWGALFHTLSSDENTRVLEGRELIAVELGDDANPAYPLLLGSFYSDRGLYGQAAEQFTAGAVSQPEHAGTFWEMACDEYMYNIFLPVEEGYIICQ